MKQSRGACSFCEPYYTTHKSSSKVPFAAVVTVAVIVAALSATLSSSITYDQKAEPYLDRSVPFVGTDTPRLDGAYGNDILIAVIDTGVDYEHPDMRGWQSEDGKVAGGYNFLETGSSPLDADGHGTQVAGVAAANGNLQGVAPHAKILAYKVSDEGSNVSSELIAEAVSRAVKDGADIINISMGVDRKNSIIEDAINAALAQGVPVVVAAGNDGPGHATIGSPGRSSGAISVGATYNNLTSSMVATLDVNEEFSYTVIPMVDTVSLEFPIDARLISAGYAKESDFENANVSGAIVIAERGSDIEEDLLYFSLKEKHAADAGAAALIIYNNIDGIFLGELIHEFIEPGYTPRIPVVSMDREEGLEILERMKNGTASNALLHLFHNPDFVAHFSSRGPVSPFYIKPDLVAPGAYINTTDAESKYNIMSGTSYAAPHVSGAAALLLEKHPGLDRHKLKAVLMTTSDAVYDAYGDRISIHETGSGRLNVTRAYEAGVAILPPSFVASISPHHPSTEVRFEIHPLPNAERGDTGNNNGRIQDVLFEGPDFAKFAHVFDEDENMLYVRISTSLSQYTIPGQHDGENASDTNNDHNNSTDAAPYGEYEGRVTLMYDGAEYTMPFVLHYTNGAVRAVVAPDSEGRTEMGGGLLRFDVAHPDGWEFAKIKVINSITEETVTVTGTPDNIQKADLEIRKDGKYWIDASIMSGGTSHTAYDTVQVGGQASEGSTRGYAVQDADWIEYDSEYGGSFAPLELVPVRQIIIAAAVISGIGAIGAVFQIRTNKKTKDARDASGANSAQIE